MLTEMSPRRGERIRSSYAEQWDKCLDFSTYSTCKPLRSHGRNKSGVTPRTEPEYPIDRRINRVLLAGQYLSGCKSTIAHCKMRQPSRQAFLISYCLDAKGLLEDLAEP
jgi:hypothetical protein